MRRVQCLYGCSTTLHHASTDHAWERPVRDTAVGWTTRARRTPHTGRGQPWAARGGFREAVRARQGLARVASVGRISVQVGLTPKPSLAAPRCSRALFRGLELFLLVGLICAIIIHHKRFVRGCTRLANMLFTPILTWYSHHVKGRLPIATPIATRAIRHLIHSLVRVQRRA